MARVMKQSLPTTVFVIDDDPAVLRRVTKESLQETNLGVLTAEDLPTAIRLLDQGYPVGAILADLNFRVGTHDESHNIHNGLEFLKYVEDRRPNLPVYVMSMDVEDRVSRQQADQMGLKIRQWYDKLGPRQDQFSPWVRIERDLILQALKSEAAFQKRAAEVGENPVELLTDEDVAEKVRTIFNYPRLTYLQYLPKECGYQLKQPVEVQCWPSETGFQARAIRIPLLQEAEGEDAVEAIDNLADMIVAEKRALDSEDAGHVIGYARFIKDQLSGYLEQDPIAEPVKAPALAPKRK